MSESLSPHLEHGGLWRAELDEGRLARGHLDDGAAQRPDVGGRAVAALALVDHLRRHVLQQVSPTYLIWTGIQKKLLNTAGPGFLNGK